MQPPPTTAARSFRAAVIGSPISHSKSPLLHDAAYEVAGIPCSYTAIDVDESSLAAFLGSVRAEPGWMGLSVTMPLKAATARLMDTNTAQAAALGVVNTVVVDGTGLATTLTGHNTDVIGVANALAGAGVRTPRRAVVLGGGGTAAAAVAGLARLGATTAQVVVRRPRGMAELVGIGAGLGITVEVRHWSEVAESLRTADVVVCTLPPRAGDPLAALLGRGFRTAGTLLDVAYDPWPSALAAAWRNAGGSIVPGLDMLLHQAVEQVHLFFPDVDQDRQVLLDAMCDAAGVTRR